MILTLLLSAKGLFIHPKVYQQCGEHRAICAVQSLKACLRRYRSRLQQVLLPGPLEAL